MTDQKQKTLTVKDLQRILSRQDPDMPVLAMDPEAWGVYKPATRADVAKMRVWQYGDAEGEFVVADQRNAAQSHPAFLLGVQ